MTFKIVDDYFIGVLHNFTTGCYEHLEHFKAWLCFLFECTLCSGI